MSKPTGLVAARQPQSLPRVFRRNQRIHHIWAYAMTDVRHGLHAHKIPMTDTALVVRGIFAEARAVVEETLWR